MLLLLGFLGLGMGRAAGESDPGVPGWLLAVQNEVAFKRAGGSWQQVVGTNGAPAKRVHMPPPQYGTNFIDAPLHPGKGLEITPGSAIWVGPDSRAHGQLGDGVPFVLRANTIVTMTNAGPEGRVLGILRGLCGIHHNPTRGQLKLQFEVCNAIFRGTEIVASVDEAGVATFRVMNGVLTVTNDAGSADVSAGKVVVVEGRNRAPRPVTGVAALPVEWMLYYPMVLVPGDLALEPAAARRLARVLERYDRGRFVEALADWPNDGVAEGAGERSLRAMLQLGVGSGVDAARREAEVGGTPARRALALLLGALGSGGTGRLTNLLEQATASEALAASYHFQSVGDMAGALRAANLAATKATNGLVLARQAELEFGFGRARRAESLSREALRRSPDLAPAWVVDGFVHLARRDAAEAADRFANAKALDPWIGNAWLGAGLAAIQSGRIEEGFHEILGAVASERERWILRAYLAKAYSVLDASRTASQSDPQLVLLARRELDAAMAGAPGDPTPWLYSALERDRLGDVGGAISDLGRAIQLNGNRAVYRSRYLLDQDAAVGGAALANIMSRAGMVDASLREASKAVLLDYADPRAHEHLAAAYDAQRDPTRFSLRHEAEWFGEHLVATMLAPVGVGTLSQRMSPNEYSRAFEVDGLRGDSTTEYLSRGEVRERATAEWTGGRVAYALDLDGAWRRGEGGAHDLRRIEAYTRVKVMATPEDSLLLLAKYMAYETGDFSARYAFATNNSSYRLREFQEPIAFAGWHHEWSPEHHTMLLAGRLADRQSLTVANQGVPLRYTPNAGDPYRVSAAADIDYENQFEAWSTELQQVSRLDLGPAGEHTAVLGMRYQAGDITARSILTNHYAADSLGGNPFVSSTDRSFSHLSAYGYHVWKVRDGLWLEGGIAYDHAEVPTNYRRPPVADDVAARSQLSPKAAAAWSPGDWVTFRAMWARSLGGVSVEDSFRLEPTQLAGFSQSFRSLAPESRVGSVEVPSYDSAGAAVDLKLGGRTFLGFSAERHCTGLTRDTGFLDARRRRVPQTRIETTREELGYEEWRGGATLDQVFATNVIGEVRYRVSQARLWSALDELPPIKGFSSTSRSDALRHHVATSVVWRPTPRFWIRTEVRNILEHATEPPPEAGSGPLRWNESMTHLNLVAGWESRRRRLQVVVGVLDINDDRGRLSLLVDEPEMPRSRTFYTQVRLSF